MPPTDTPAAPETMGKKPHPADGWLDLLDKIRLKLDAHVTGGTAYVPGDLAELTAAARGAVAVVADLAKL